MTIAMCTRSLTCTEQECISLARRLEVYPVDINRCESNERSMRRRVPSYFIRHYKLYQRLSDEHQQVPVGPKI